MPTQPKFARNYLLASLSQSNLTHILPDLQQILLTVGQVIYSSEDPINYVYFPSDGMILLLQTFDDGMQAEVGMIGREGMIGQSVLSGVNTSFTEALVQAPGMALRMQVTSFRMKANSNAELRSTLLSYSASTHIQMMQIAACNAHHPLRQRLIRLLLMAQDRIRQADIPMTQTTLAAMLSVQRPSVTIVAAGLQRAGLIHYQQGKITLIDRPGLEVSCCECYNRIRKMLYPKVKDANAS